MLRILKTQFVSNLVYRFIGIESHVFGNVDNLVLNVFLGCFPGFLFNQVAKIVGRQMKFIGKISN